MNIDTHIIITFLLIIVSCLFLSTRVDEHFTICHNPQNKFYPVQELGWKNWWRNNQSATNIEIGDVILDRNIPNLSYDGI